MGDCVGSTVEVDPLASKKEMMLYGRVKVTRDVNQRHLQRTYLRLDDLCVPIDVEMEPVLKAENTQSKDESCSSSTYSETSKEDDDVISEFRIQICPQWNKISDLVFRI